MARVRERSGAGQVFWEWALGIAVFMFCGCALIPVWLLATHQVSWREAVRGFAAFGLFAGMAYGAFRERRERGRSRSQ